MADHQIIQAMERFGGSFAQAIAQAAHRADANNLARLKAAFPELWEQYAEMAVLAANRAASERP